MKDEINVDSWETTSAKDRYNGENLGEVANMEGAKYGSG